MISGNAMLWLAVAASLVSMLAYIGVSLGRKGYLGTARMGFGVMAASLIAASAMLLHAFLTRRFDLEYVFSYSSRDLSRYYTISAFWGGQEGGFLLWAFFGALLGAYFLIRARKDEPLGMIFLNAIQLFMLVMMLKKSPFAPLSAEMLRGMGVAPGMAPMDGQGLNPLLQDPWMAIHPPLLFLGYAAMAIPFAMALGALVRGDYDRWVARALPWTVFAWASLGSGIFVGAYWAYKVLGWGGYWGWDPVENASLIPWLTSTALVHGMLTQRAVKGMRRSNLALAIFSFLLVMYGTYLTRSGVLDKFSNHSFVDAGLGGLLTFFTLALTVLGLGLLIFRWRSIPNSDEGLYGTSASREFAFLLTVLVLGISALLVLVGTSSPLITSWLAKLHFASKPSQVETSFYLWTNTPVGILLALLLSVCPLLAWRGKKAELKRILPLPLALGVAAVLIAALGKTESDALTKGAMILTAGLNGSALGLNLTMLLSLLRNRKPFATGGYIAHVGLALTLIGVVASSGYCLHQRVALAKGECKRAFGMNFRFDGIREDPRAPGSGVMAFRVTRGGYSFEAAPRLEANPRTGETMQKPHIQKLALGDLYISPQAYQPPVDAREFTLVKGSAPMEISGYQVRFLDYQVPQHGMNSGAMSVGAVLEVSRDGKTERVVPMLEVGPNGNAGKPAKLFGGPMEVSLTRISVEQHSATLGLAGPGIQRTPEIGVVEVSTKPLVNLVWLGTLLMVLGGGIATLRRARQARSSGDEEDSPAAPAKKRAVRK